MAEPTLSSPPVESMPASETTLNGLRSLGAGTIHELFEQQAQRTPDRVALIVGHQEITYRELHEQTNCLARQLLGQGEIAGGAIGVLLDRSVDLVVASLATFKAGGVYVPMDIAHPRARLNYIIKDADLKLIITTSGLADRVDHGAANMLCLDDISHQVASDYPARQTPTVDPEDPAYVVYTSGSTGNPKGVVIPHRVFVRCSDWARRIFCFNPDDRFLFKSIRAPEELLFPFSIGAAAIVAPPDTDREPSTLVDTVLRHGINVLGLSPAILRLVAAEPRLKECRSLTQVFSSGEGLATDVVERFRRQSNATLYNFYGLAEAPYTALWKCTGNETSATVPIGRPFDATLRVLDADLRPKGAGEIGELYVGGPGVALRYLNLPELTAERFVEDVSGHRLYRTGDLGYHDDTGVFHITGRLDFQVKVRGFRVELGEVEAALLSYGSIREAAVILRNARPDEPRLTGCLVVNGDQSLTVQSVRSFLSERLPDYAIPSDFTVLPRLPLTLTGKVDRQALQAAPGSELPAGTSYVAPGNERERQLIKIWQDLLSRDHIGIHDNFFFLGGHSLAATQVIARIRAEFRCELPLRALFEAPTVSELSSRIASAGQVAAPLFCRRRREGPVELSFAQERLWFLDQLQFGSSAYHIPDVYELHGVLDVDALERSLAAIVQRHELLRTTLQLIDGKPVQVIASTADLKISVIDRSGLSPEEQEREIDRQIAQNSATVFDLATGPLLQLRVVRLAPARSLLLVNMHHVASDDWSLGVLYRELSLFYNAFRRNKPLQLPDLPIQYADYAICQREWLEKGELSRQLDYWRDQLSGLPTLELPTDFARPPRQTFTGTRTPFTLSSELTARLRAFSRRENATHFMTLLAAFQVLLCRYSGQSDVAIGTPIANRRHLEVEGLFGFFVNMLVLRGDLDGDPSFRDLVSRVRRNALDAYQNQDLPFEKLVEALNPERDLSRPPLFQVMFALQDVPTYPLVLDELTVRRRIHAVHATHFDLELYLSTDGPAWSGFIGYNTDLFRPATIKRMIGHYQTLLESLLDQPNKSIFAARLLDFTERHQLLQWSGGRVDYAGPECIHQLFEQQAARVPESVALQFEDRVLTYGELNDRAHALADYLRCLGVAREIRVAVCVERSLDMVVALLAVLKAGGCYVPIDIHFPPDRVSFILEDAGVELLILHESLRPICAGFKGAVLSLDFPVEPEPIDNENSPARGTNAAYIYYTSGSTGRPKGVMIEHRSVVNFLRGMQVRPGICETDVVLALTTISFDPAVLDIFLPLSVGARVVIVPEATRMDPEGLLELLHRSGATLLQATPTTWQLLMHTRWVRKELRALIGGEILTPELAREILRRCGELWNLYGPTETTVWSTAGRIERPDQISVGKPVPNQRAYIVDRHNQLAPVGVPGELLIGGAGVGRYYVSQPELTAQRFLPDPFSDENNARAYRTGDLCRYQRDGNIEFLGRIDHQIKIRGFRVEPGEIEASLIEHPAIAQCAVIDRVDKSGDRQLVAYFIPTDRASVPEHAVLRDFLGRKLPDYMLPAAFVVVDKFPLTRSGKIQRAALPDPQLVRRASTGQAEVPRDPLARQVARIWQDILQIEGVSLTDDFFALGGHSLMAVRLMAQINATFGIRIPLATIFRSPTIESLVVAIRTSNESAMKQPGLIRPGENEQGQPIFWAPSIGAVERVIESYNLARILRDHYRFYGFDPVPEVKDIAQLGRHCLRLIRAEQPRGPYFLAGYCQCGHVAHEIATLLQEQGETVAMLAIIDSSARDLAPSFRQRLYWLRDGFRGIPRAVVQRGRSYVHRKMFGKNGANGLNGDLQNAFVAHAYAGRRHRARRFSGTLTLFRSDEWLSRLPHSPKLGWDALASTIRVHPVNCDHIAVLTDPISLQVIVHSLKESLVCQPA